MITLSRAPASLPEGRRIYAIGDIHGCDVQLGNLHEIIAEDLARRPVDAPLLLHIGDYVDRGADTAGVLRRLLARIADRGRAGGQSARQPRRDDAARAVRRSAGGDRLAVHRRRGRRWRVTASIRTRRARAGRSTCRPSISISCADLTLTHRDGGYFFVHGGVRPGVPLEQQAREDLLRMRQPFLYSEMAFGAVVVHGHSPVKEPVVRHNRIAIDTGAVFGGKMTCLVLEGETLGFLTADPVGEPVSIAHR